MAVTARKGIILAGGSGSRLYPVTAVVSKQLLPIYDKPMIYYPLSVLMMTGVREIAIITTPHDQALFQALLGDGSQWGIALSYITQPSPDGLAQAYLLAEDFLDGAPSVMVLGDNIFFGHGLREMLRSADARISGGTVFGYEVADPQRYGVLAFDDDGRATGIVEKPEVPPSEFAVTGLYFLDGSAPARARKVKPSRRGELEITCLLQMYLDAGELDVETMGAGYAWLDTGTPDSLLEAADFVSTLERRQGSKIACPEEIAFRQNFIDRDALRALATDMGGGSYAHYLQRLADKAK
ncbi:glucose-1-phosphate thymidylyltransferase [Glycocaulis albus]|jgi:glucose-1-phosphate thymidylyltransferase|uniref:Glucose-1-phosphate thymidylyltransferase n=1 Tax=Glycocaulis albus TaxID=1382801 RepID=A0ABQ1XNU6_9PROT|nr:glucose-1-phosphate thymidylyltransferase RfbA [Glycocaulis albus]MBV5258314.1 glucose-1-phosphate thymidylyltransferase RfbA [Synechococcus moorigangaii CMS01]GGG98914.1 glucose-1-phosphate thymidylyltransferase [Glycocaulis albus]